MPFDKSKFLTRFLDEARDHVKKINEGLLILEKLPDDTETLNGIFRAAHTIKGSSRMMKLIPISTVAHKIEDALDAIRQKTIRPSQELYNLIFKGIETIGDMIELVAAGEDVNQAPDDLCEQFEIALKVSEVSFPCVEVAEEKNEAPEEASQIANPSITEGQLSNPSDAKPEKKESEKSIKPSETIRINSDKLDELIKLMGEIVSAHSRQKHLFSGIAFAEKLAKKSLELFLKNKGERDDSLEEMLNLSIELFQNLQKITGEFKEDINIQGLLVSDLQDRSLKMRMLPLSTIFDTFRMTVRNLSQSFGKDIHFIIEGGETELDKKIIEKIGDSLIHMIRNSIDHGIETPEQRHELGKPAIGTLKLSARYEGGNVVIELSDDGAGIPLEKIREKAIKKQLIRSADAMDLTETELLQFIFHPGFSTNEIITDLSGRGVGMDVVKQNIIDDLKGSVHIRTESGRGTIFSIQLPLTMAIIHVFFITASNMTFAVPDNFIDVVISVPEKEVIHVMDKKAVRLRDHIIPIIRLDEILSVPTSAPSSETVDEWLILIGSNGSEKLGLIIDSILTEEYMVIKQLPSHMKNMPFVSGCIISGTNQIINVLHMPKIIEAARDSQSKRPTEVKASPVEKKEAIHILVIDDSVSTREIEKNILESYGYQVTLASDGIEGLEKAKKFPYHLVITDIEMPRMDGFTLTETLRKDEQYKDVPIILVTSLDKEADKRRGILVGADAYIVKGSFDQTTLLESIENLVG